MTNLTKLKNSFLTGYENLKLVVKSSRFTELVQGADKDTIVFYNLREDEKSKGIFLSRIKGSPATFIVPLLEKNNEFKDNIIQIKKEKFGVLKKELVDMRYPLDPKIKVIGVTGTNGKTTIVNLVCQLLAMKNEKVLSVGTLGVLNSSLDIIEPSMTTSPSYTDVRRILNDYRALADCFVFEVSSHGLDQGRFEGMQFDAVGFTNLSQDHLDYHRTMENYLNAKIKIFELLKENGRGFINCPSVDSLLSNLIDGQRIFESDYNQLLGSTPLPDFLRIPYNRENVGLALCLSFGSNRMDLKSLDLKLLKPVPGRFEVIYEGNKMAIVDYAHTPEALRLLLVNIKKTFGEKTIAIVFGAGGDRDRDKRSLMGAAASEHSDRILLTSDNPRFEEPMSIINDISKGLEKGYETEVDRKRAIEKALGEMSDNEIVVIAGKGHESYQEIKGERFDFSDVRTIKDYWSIEND